VNTQSERFRVLTKRTAEKFEVVFCAAGGWAGGSIGGGSTDEFVASVDRMLSFNLVSALQTARIASATLQPGGLLVGFAD
jgi:hypothetical protein